VPQVRPSVPGPKMICFDCFSYPALDLRVDTVKTVVGFAVFSAQVRSGEPRATRPVPIGSCYDTDFEGTADRSEC
jgi:hypothetical protein